MAINIWGKYRNNKPEILDTASAAEVEKMVGEYRMAYGSDWLIWHGRRKDGEGKKDDSVRVRDGSNVLQLHEYMHLRR
jgi:hypothetical protein